MTRKDYELIAKAIKHSVENAPKTGSSMIAIRYTTNCIAEVMSMDNPNFNRAKFLTHCGLD